MRGALGSLSMVGRPFVLCVVATAALLGGVAPAEAQPSPADQAAAEALFNDGKNLATAGKCAEAYPKLAESQRLDPAIGTIFAMASCDESLGRTATAWVLYTNVATEARRLGQAGRERVAQEHAAALLPKLTKLVIEVPIGSRVDGLEVKRDGEVARDGSWGTALPVDPGAHVITATAPGRVGWKKEIDVRGEGATVKIAVPLLAKGAAPVPAASSTGASPAASSPPPAVEKSDGSMQKTLGWVALGTGAASVLVGTIFGIKAKSSWDASRPNCHGANECNAEGLDQITSAKNAATVSTITFILGGLLGATGTTLLVTAPSTGRGGEVAWRTTW